jgi:hypothetical protein
MEPRREALRAAGNNSITHPSEAGLMAHPPGVVGRARLT